ncbi:transposase [Endozoicomonas sp.]|uniref:transposase n=1 Tax=Endozoicomonas sp. TaxID=1892382 RepID=UPI002883E80A|nr:transposase [Endozoicomonas sp.]
MVLVPKPTHPEGEPKELGKPLSSATIEVDTFEGKIHVEWEPGASVTPMGQLDFFIQFLKTGCWFEPWVIDCPLVYTSNNASGKVNVLDSLLLSILSGHKRYAHIATLTGDGVNSKLLGMKKVVSDDTARRGLLKIDEEEGVEWLQDHLQQCYEPLLRIPWIMDVDVTIKTIYGDQEGAVIGYNPHNHGRPSHTYHTYMIANLKLILEVEVQPGNQGNSAHSLPGLISLLKRLPKECWPEFVRGDCDWGSDRVMTELEQIGCGYLFKIKKTVNVKKAIHHAHCSGGWTRYDKHWEGKEATLKLSLWTKERRIVIVRRRLPKNDVLLLEHDSKKGQKELDFIEDPENIKLFEYSVLVTTLDNDVASVIDHYRDRADCENNFDEIKNQWGWGGYTTQDLKRCRFISRMVALIYNWWTLFVKLSNPDSHKESITSRPLLMSAIGRLTESGRQQTISITSQHNLMKKYKKCRRICVIFLIQLK